ncbi:MAG: hypothetical protein QXW58_01370 [Thermosphaera sp.]
MPTHSLPELVCVTLKGVQIKYGLSSLDKPLVDSLPIVGSH